MSKYYLDLTNFSTGYGKLASRAAKALDKGDIEKSGLNVAKLNYKSLRRKHRDPQNDKMTLLQKEKFGRKISRPLDKVLKDPDKLNAVSGHLAGKYPKLMKESVDAYS